MKQNMFSGLACDLWQFRKYSIIDVLFSFSPPKIAQKVLITPCGGVVHVCARIKYRIWKKRLNNIPFIFPATYHYESNKIIEALCT